MGPSGPRIAVWCEARLRMVMNSPSCQPYHHVNPITKQLGSERVRKHVNSQVQIFNHSCHLSISFHSFTHSFSRACHFIHSTIHAVTQSFHVMSCNVIYFHFISFHFVLFHFISFHLFNHSFIHFVSCQLSLVQFSSFCFVSFHVIHLFLCSFIHVFAPYFSSISFHFMPCHLM